MLTNLLTYSEPEWEGLAASITDTDGPREYPCGMGARAVACFGVKKTTGRQAEPPLIAPL